MAVNVQTYTDLKSAEQFLAANLLNNPQVPLDKRADVEAILNDKALMAQVVAAGGVRLQVSGDNKQGNFLFKDFFDTVAATNSEYSARALSLKSSFEGRQALTVQPPAPADSESTLAGKAIKYGAPIAMALAGLAIGGPIGAIIGLMIGLAFLAAGGGDWAMNKLGQGPKLVSQTDQLSNWYQQQPTTAVQPAKLEDYLIDGKPLSVNTPNGPVPFKQATVQYPGANGTPPTPLTLIGIAPDNKQFATVIVKRGNDFFILNEPLATTIVNLPVAGTNPPQQAPHVQPDARKLGEALAISQKRQNSPANGEAMVLNLQQFLLNTRPPMANIATLDPVSQKIAQDLAPKLTSGKQIVFARGNGANYGLIGTTDAGGKFTVSELVVITATGVTPAGLEHQEQVTKLVGQQFQLQQNGTLKDSDITTITGATGLAPIAKPPLPPGPVVNTFTQDLAQKNDAKNLKAVLEVEVTGGVPKVFLSSGAIDPKKPTNPAKLRERIALPAGLFTLNADGRSVTLTPATLAPALATAATSFIEGKSVDLSLLTAAVKPKVDPAKTAGPNLLDRTNAQAGLENLLGAQFKEKIGQFLDPKMPGIGSAVNGIIAMKNDPNARLFLIHPDKAVIGTVKDNKFTPMQVVDIKKFASGDNFTITVNPELTAKLAGKTFEVKDGSIKPEDMAKALGLSAPTAGLPGIAPLVALFTTGDTRGLKKEAGAIWAAVPTMDELKKKLEPKTPPTPAFADGNYSVGLPDVLRDAKDGDKNKALAILNAGKLQFAFETTVVAEVRDGKPATTKLVVTKFGQNPDGTKAKLGSETVDLDASFIKPEGTDNVNIAPAKRLELLERAKKAMDKMDTADRVMAPPAPPAPPPAKTAEVLNADAATRLSAIMGREVKIVNIGGQPVFEIAKLDTATEATSLSDKLRFIRNTAGLGAFTPDIGSDDKGSVYIPVKELVTGTPPTIEDHVLKKLEEKKDDFKKAIDAAVGAATAPPAVALPDGTYTSRILENGAHILANAADKDLAVSYKIGGGEIPVFIYHYDIVTEVKGGKATHSLVVTKTGDYDGEYAVDKKVIPLDPSEVTLKDAKFAPAKPDEMNAKFRKAVKELNGDEANPYRTGLLTEPEGPLKKALTMATDPKYSPTTPTGYDRGLPVTPPGDPNKIITGPDLAV